MRVRSSQASNRTLGDTGTGAADSGGSLEGLERSMEELELTARDVEFEWHEHGDEHGEAGCPCR